MPAVLFTSTFTVAFLPHEAAIRAIDIKRIYLFIALLFSFGLQLLECCLYALCNGLELLI